MRALTTFLALFIAGAPHLASASSPKVAGLEVLVQQGLAGNPDVVPITADGRTWLLGCDGNDVRAWTTDSIASESWTLTREWKGSTSCFIHGEDAMRPWVLVRGSESAAPASLYWAGSFAHPALDVAGGLPRDADSAYYLTKPGDRTRTWDGIAAHGKAGWALFGTDGHTWRSFAPRGAPTVIAAEYPIRDGLLALRDTGDSNHNGVSDEWTIYEQMSKEDWRPMTLPGVGATFAVLEPSRYDGFAVRVHDNEPRHCFVLDEHGAPVPVEQALPGVRVAEKVWYADHELASVQVNDERADDPHASHELQFVRDGGRWRPVVEALPGAPRSVTHARSFAGGHGVAIYEPATSTTKGAWRWYFRDASDHWQPLKTVFPSLPATPWDVQTFADGAGFGVQDGDRWAWMLRDGERWRALQDVVAGVPKDIAAVRSDALDEGLAIEGPPGRWQHFTRGDRSWAEVHQLVPGLAPTKRRADVTLGDGRFYVERDGRRRWYLRDEAGRWRALGNTVLADPASAHGPAALPAQVDAISDPADALVKLDVHRELPLWLARHANGEWADLSVDVFKAPGRIASVDVLANGAQLLVHDKDHADRAPLRVLWRNALGWASLERVHPGAPANPRDVITFLGENGLGVLPRADTKHHEDDAWRFYARGSDDEWHDLVADLPHAPSALAAAYSVADDDGLVVQEAGDANGNRKPGEWFHYLRTKHGWAPASEVAPGAPPAIWEMKAFADGRGIAIEDDADSNHDGRAYEWHYFLRGTDGLLRAVEDELAVPSGHHATSVQSFWGADGLRVEDDSGATRWLARTSDHWALLPPPPIGRTALELRSSRSGRLLAALESDGERRRWTVVTFDGKAWRQLPGASPISDVALREDHVALRSAGKVEAWRWYQLASGRWSPTSTSDGGADSIGHAWRNLGADAIALDGARHTLERVAASSVPRPLVWFTSSSGVRAAGRVYRVAKEMLPEGVEAYGAGPTGGVLLYSSGGHLQAAGFRHGAMGTLTLQLADGKSSLRFLANRFADGTTKLHRMDDATRAIWMYARPSHDGRLFFDERGFFYNETEKVAERLSFRNGDDVYTLDQLGSRLFRPDRLESDLGLRAGQLFQLSSRDHARIDEAKKALVSVADVAKLRPPTMHVSVVSDHVTTPTATFRIQAHGARRIATYVEGAGQSRDADGLACTGDCSVERGVQLLPGENYVRVTITDGNGLTKTERRRVFYEAPAGQKADLWAAVVAPSSYAHANALPLARKDADTIDAALRAQEGKLYAKVHVERWCGAGCDHPADDRDALLDGLRAFFAHVEDGDAAILYISGHGTRVGDEYYFLPGDADPDRTSSMISWAALRDAIRTNHLSHKLIVLDTCHSGETSDSARQRMIQEQMDLDGIYVLSASAADAKAFETTDLGNGILTHVFRIALSGRADDAPEDGKITFAELATYVASEVRELARSHRLVQEPQVPIVDERIDYEVAAVTKTRFPVYVSTQDADGYPDHTLLSKWAGELERQISGFRRVSDEDVAPFELTVRSLANDDVRVRLVDRNGTKLLVIDSTKAADAIRRIREALEQARPR